MSTENIKVTYDPYAVPPNVKSVVYLKGSWYDVGYQYGTFMPESVQRIIVFGYDTAVIGYGNVEDAKKYGLPQQVDYINQHAPELMDLYKGLADSTGYPLDDVLMGFALATPSMADDCYDADEAGITEGRGNEAQKMCSNIVAWGEATADGPLKGKLVCGANTDAIWIEHYFGPAVIIMLDNGTTLLGYDGLNGNAWMNDKGVAVVTSSGQGDPAKGDFQVRMPYKFSEMLAIANSKTAEEAKDYFCKLQGPGMGENLQFCDKDHNSFVVEHTAMRNMIRQSGYLDEKAGCYTIATNDYNIKEMQDSLYTGDRMYDDCHVRYWTEEKFLLDNWGKVTKETLANALGSTRYYVPEDYQAWLNKHELDWPLRPETTWKGETGWSDEVFWNQCEWAPENRDIKVKCILRTVMVPEDHEVNIMVGSKDTYISQNPNAIGKYSKINIKPSDKTGVVEPFEVNDRAQFEAELQIYKGAKACFERKQDGCIDKDKVAWLDEARQCWFNGVNLSNLAVAMTGVESLKNFGLATTEFCKAQCYAKLAQEDSEEV